MATSLNSQKKLGWFLCWAVVFADIGTSLYYVPGILYGEVGNLAGLFVLMTSAVFVLLVLKYIEITDRYPEGGGVVTVATHAFGPWVGALGGMFITVDYFLTAAISSVSGVAYLNSIFPLGQYIALIAIISILLLGILNIIGIRESAGVTAIVAVAAFVVDIILVVVVASQVRPEGWAVVWGSMMRISTLSAPQVLAGFAGSFLAFSGLESISQLSPAMEEPRKKSATKAMFLVVGAILITSPLLTLFSTNLLTAKTTAGSETIIESVARVREREIQAAKTNSIDEKILLEQQVKEGKEYSDRFISELGAQYGATLLKIIIVATASVLLLFAANTAIIGAYHVFIALTRQNFLPQFLQTHNKQFNTPHWSVLLAISAPIIIILVTKGDVAVLGSLYAFGLLGAFSLSSLGLDIVRFKEKKRNVGFYVGLVTTGLVILAWLTNLYTKQAATIFGGSITLVGMAIAYTMRSYFPHVAFKAELAIADPSDVEKGQLLVPVYGEFDRSLFEFVGNYAKNNKKIPVLFYIREFNDIYQTVSENIELDEEARRYLTKAQKVLEDYKVQPQFLYATATDYGPEINQSRKVLRPALTILSPHKQRAIFDFLHGDTVKEVINNKYGNVLIYTGK